MLLIAVPAFHTKSRYKSSRNTTRWQTSSCTFPAHYYGRLNNAKKGTTLTQSFLTAILRHVAKPCKQVHANMKNDVPYRHVVRGFFLTTQAMHTKPKGNKIELSLFNFKWNCIIDG